MNSNRLRVSYDFIESNRNDLKNQGDMKKWERDGKVRGSMKDDSALREDQQVVSKRWG